MPFCRDLSRYAGFLRQFLTDGLASLRKPRTGETAKTLLHIAPRFHCTPRFMPLAFLTAVLLGSAIYGRKLRNGRGGEEIVCNSYAEWRQQGIMKMQRPVDQEYGKYCLAEPMLSTRSYLRDGCRQTHSPQNNATGRTKNGAFARQRSRNQSTFRKHRCRLRPSSFSRLRWRSCFCHALHAE